MAPTSAESLNVPHGRQDMVSACGYQQCIMVPKTRQARGDHFSPEKQSFPTWGHSRELWGMSWSE